MLIDWEPYNKGAEMGADYGLGGIFDWSSYGVATGNVTFVAGSDPSLGLIFEQSQGSCMDTSMGLT